MAGITLISEARGTRSTTVVTNESGDFLFVNMAADTYTVEVTTENPVDKDHPDGKLLPYLTANLLFEVSDRKNVLLVPNSALRWLPRVYRRMPGTLRYVGPYQEA